MKPSLPEQLLLQLSEWTAAGTALHFPVDRWNDLERRTGSAAGEFGFTDKEEFIQWLVSSPLTREQLEILASHLTIAETYFWREPQIFEALREHILPELIHSRGRRERRLRIWSAGCASGEEPYSLAIALDRVIPAGKNWQVSILATDINPRILRKATAGVYGEWSFRSAPAWLKKEYFLHREDGRFEILPEIRQMVTFTYLNLAEDVYPSPLNNTHAMDIIFCRNVLMYFKPERAGQVGQGLHHALVDGGWLVVGASELSHEIFSQFAPVYFPGAIVYQKARQKSRPLPDFRMEGLQGQEPLPVSTRIEQPPDFVKPSLREEVHEKAVKARAPEENKDASSSYAHLVRALANQGKLAEALAVCEKGLAADKLDHELHYLRAIILQEQNRDTEASASLKSALYLEPNFSPAHFVLGNLLLRHGDRRAAKRCFENVLALLSARRQEEILTESEGLTAGRFREIVQATLQVWE
jgi:chemotaxis protein methyltransferase CheR